jgi:hypothetical protein
MRIGDGLELGREAYARSAWGDAYARLSAADRDASLEPEDLERLAMAAYLIGMEAEATATWTRAHHEHLDRGDVERDTHALPFYELTTQIATLEPPPPEWAQLLGALQGNQEAMDGFVRVTAGVTSPAEFFSEENIGRMLAPAGQGVVPSL